ncbi:MAG: PPK2 family polyphosphate kinase [Bacteroidota bacterium]|nr:PPK2 family polyphosphate kinase [Bacteroidota bacterium]
MQGKKIKLSTIDTRAPEKFHKEEIKKELQKLKFKLEELQNLLYAENKHALLIILQGMDASGKDGAVKNVFASVNPMGCRVTSFKQPTALEMKHDFLWRIHQQVPEKGMIAIFNRSHYEDVLVQLVHNDVEDKVVKKRYEHINNFEKLLIENSTTVLKFYMHISKEEQLLRLEERINDKTKMWKYDEHDIKERMHWKEYMKAYENAFEHCSIHAPWHILPSDQNWYKEYLLAKKIVETLEGFKMKYPGLERQE